MTPTIADAGGQQDLIFANGFEIATQACDPNNPDANGDGLLDLACIEPFVPPNPADVAPPIDPTVITDFSVANEFLYAGPEAIQHGVSPGTIRPYRMAVLRGRVVGAGQSPLPGVLVRVLNHPEFGYTYTRADGVYDLAVNGGGEITVDHRKQGFLRAQRSVVTPWKNWRWLPDATMIPLDSVVSTIALGPGSSMQVHRASLVTDNAGVRQATVMFQPGTQGQLILADGTAQPLPSLQFRATEYTVGPNGPSRMPAALPGRIAYTYAVELSADEAIAANARSVEFSQPVSLYFENFLGFPVGADIPLGSYDFRLGSWLPAPDGRVIQIIGTSNGLADIDVDGSGLPADVQALAALGITDAERSKLAQTYQVGETLWRSVVTHLTPFDCNFPYGPPPEAEPPAPPPDQPDSPEPPDVPQDDNQPGPDTAEDDDPEPCKTTGSIIDCSNARLGEAVAIAGTPYELYYQSTRLPGSSSGQFRVRVPVTGPEIPQGVKRLEVGISLGGESHHYVIDPPQTNFYKEFDWDGKDAYGRVWQGPLKAHVRVGYVYDVVYQASQAELEESFGGFSGYPISGNESAREMTLYQEWSSSSSARAQQLYTGSWDATGLGLGGWTFSAQHLFDPVSRTLYSGSGERRPIGRSGAIGIVEVGPYTEPYDSDGFPGGGPSWRLGPGGQVYALFPGYAGCGGECGPGPFVQKITLKRPGDNVATVVLQNCETPSPSSMECGEPNEPINGINLSGSTPLWQNAQSLAVLDDDRLILQTENKLYRVTPSRAEVVPLLDLASIATYCDTFTSDPKVLGNRVYFACEREVDSAGFIFMVWPNGDATRLAGGGSATAVGTSALELSLGYIPKLLPASDGGVYFYEPNQYWIRKIGADGIVRAIAGAGTNAFSPDGSVAAQSPIGSVRALAISRDGTLLYSEHGGIREVAKNGQLHTLVGGGTRTLYSDTETSVVAAPYAIAPSNLQIAADGSVVFQVGYRGNLFDWSGSSFRFDEVGQGFNIPSEDGSEVYAFDHEGRHLRTINSVTGAIKESLQYNAAGYLLSVTDGDGNTTSIERDADNGALAVVSPYGVRTDLQYHSDGLLSGITAASGQHWAMTYKPGWYGLLETFTTPRGYFSSFEWSVTGRLLKDSNAEGGFKSIDFGKSASWQTYKSTITTAMGREAELARRNTAGGTTRRWVTSSDGSNARQWVGRGRDRDVKKSTGEEIITSVKPDPRFGALSSYTGSIVVDHPDLPPWELESTRVAVPTVPNSELGQLDLGVEVEINGRYYSRIYDSATQSWLLTSPENRQITTTIDDQSRPTRVQVPGLAAVDLSYDTHGHLQGISAGNGADQRQWAFGYGANGYLNSLQDPLGRLTTFTKDMVGRTVQATQPGNRVIGITWDANNNVTKVTPPGGSSHEFSYNKVDRLTGYAPPVIGTATNGTDFVDNLDSQLQQVSDADGRVATMGFSSHTPLPGTLTMPSGTRSFDFSSEGQLLGIDSTSGISNDFQWIGSLPSGEIWQGPVAGSVMLQYDEVNGHSNFWIAKRTIDTPASTPVEITYGYDNDGLLTAIHAPGADLVLTRNALNGLLEGTDLGSISDTWSYNGFAEPIGYSTRVNANSIYQTSFTRDKLGRITQRVETIQGTAHTYDYVYDLAGRLESVSLDGSALASWTWDANGNRLSATTPSGSTSCVYDAQDRLASCGQVTFTRNLSGQLTERSDATAGTTTQYQYDMFGNLRHVELADGTQIDYLIDNLNRRIGKKVNGSLVRGLLYQGDLQPVAELDAAGNIVSTFVYAARSHVPSYMLKDGQVYRIISDHLGSPRLVINAASGTVAQRMDYDAWGKVILDTNPGFQPFGFAGGLYDRDTGLVRFGARDYNPATGRWTTKDPILFNGGDANLYGYVGGDPLNYIDPNGLWAWGDPLPQWLVDYSAGLGDGLSLGGTELVRDWMDTNDMVNFCSGAYSSGKYSGYGLGTAIGIGAGARALQLEVNVLSKGNIFKIISKRLKMGFRVDPAHHGKPWGHTHSWRW